MILIALAILSWVAFCIFIGRFEALFWHVWARNPVFGFNPHKTRLLVYIRASVFVAASCMNPLLALGHLLVFPFIHNGAMYSHRNDIDDDVYTDRWQSEPSATSSAEINFSYNARYVMFALGIFTYISCFLR
jgi:hypothetical protein